MSKRSNDVAPAEPRAFILRPGMMLMLHSKVVGGVEYRRVDLPAPKEGDKKAERWETTKLTDDPKEVYRAGIIRSRALNEVRMECSVGEGWLLYPKSDEKKVDAAIARARAMCEKHNATAKYTRIYLTAMKGELMDNDEENARTVASQIRKLIASMDQGLKDLDVETVRRAATDARAMLSILTDDKRKAASAAIEAARSAARALVSRVEKNGEKAAKVFKDLSDEMEAIGAARVAFLEIPTGDEQASEPLPATDRFAGLEV